MRLYKPEVFQGNLRKKNYFEGWYFKQVTRDLSDTVSVIPGISIVKSDPHAFIQVVNGSTGTSDYVRYPPDEFKWERRRLYVKVGSSVFTSGGVVLDIRGESTSLTGKIGFTDMVRYPRRILSPGIMGWYSFVPFMECNHGIVSVNHDLQGEISFNGRVINFDGGKGYIEKDWGVSFPEAWIWIQSNNFNEHNTSFFLSVAKIPWTGRFFIGFISFLYLNKRFYLFSTYNGSDFSLADNNKDTLEIIVRNRNYILKIMVVRNSFCDLRAPVSGEMSRRIKESIDSELHLQLFDRFGNLEYQGTGRNVGLEIMEEIFNYI